VLDVVRDLDDNRVLEAAVTGRVDAVVSGDRDLLELGEYEGIAILTAVQFLGMLAELEGLE
jgi:predicted nucleic acid-binding protein